MKKWIIVFLITILFGISYADIIREVLPNGMDVVVKENMNNNSVAFYCFVMTGSINEGDYLGAGVSHYLEHVVSSGTTEFRTEAEYEKIGKEMGSLVNAYTNDVMTAFHIIVDKEYRSEALKILAEQMKSCRVDSVEVAREKQVILKEMVMRSTPPFSKYRQRMLELVYPNSNRKYPIIGYPELFKQVSRDELKAYYDARYVPNNMIFVAVGNFVADEMIESIRVEFSDFQRKQIQPVYLPVQNPHNGSKEYIAEFGFKQPLVSISTIIPQSDFRDEPALDAAIDILFSKRKSPIKFKLMEELKLVNYIYAYVDFSPVSTEGTIHIGFEAKDISQVRNIVEIIDEEIEKYCYSGFKKEQIDNLISRYKASKLLSTPGADDECNRIGWDIFRYGVPDRYDIFMENLANLQPEDLSKAIKKHLLPKNRIVFYGVPDGMKTELEKDDSIVIETTEPQKYEIDDNLTLLYKKNNEKPFISGVICLPVSDDYETTENSGVISFMTDLMFTGSKKYDPLDLTEWFEDHAVSYDISIGHEFYFSFKCLKDDFPKLKDIFLDALNDPIFAEKEIALAKERSMENYKRSLGMASRVHYDFRNQSIYPGLKEGVPRKERVEFIQNLTRSDLFNLHKTYMNAESAIITFLGDLSLEEAKEFAESIKKNIPDKKIRQERHPLIIPDKKVEFIQDYEFEQVNVDLNFIAPTLQSEDFYTMKVIENIFGGSRGRIHKAVRGTNDLAYFAHPYYSPNKDYGFFRITSQSSAKKIDELIEVLEDEIEKIKTELVTEEEISLAIEEHQKIMMTYIDDNSLPYFLTRYEANGLGWDFIFTSEEKLKKVTAEDIKAVANKYFKNRTLILSRPNEDVELMVE